MPWHAITFDIMQPTALHIQMMQNEIKDQDSYVPGEYLKPVWICAGKEIQTENKTTMIKAFGKASSEVEILKHDKVIDLLIDNIF